MIGKWANHLQINNAALMLVGVGTALAPFCTNYGMFCGLLGLCFGLLYGYVRLLPECIVIIPAQKIVRKSNTLRK